MFARESRRSKEKNWRLTVAIKFFRQTSSIERLDPVSHDRIRVTRWRNRSRKILIEGAMRGARKRIRSVATDRYLDSLSFSLMDRARIKRLGRGEFNALHVGYFAVSPCTVKVHADTYACACTHTFGDRSGRSFRSIRLTLVCSFAHAARIDIRKEKYFPL